MSLDNWLLFAYSNPRISPRFCQGSASFQLAFLLSGSTSSPKPKSPAVARRAAHSRPLGSPTVSCELSARQLYGPVHNEHPISFDVSSLAATLTKKGGGLSLLQDRVPHNIEMQRFGVRQLCCRFPQQHASRCICRGSLGFIPNRQRQPHEMESSDNWAKRWTNSRSSAENRGPLLI
jgi:hypothetical protein